MAGTSKLRLSLVLILITLCSVGAIEISGLLTTKQSITSTGSITNSLTLGIYSDSACTTPLTSITWGTLAPGGSITKTIYIKNLGTLSATLQCTLSSWSPADAPNHITITWNKENTSLAPQASTQATLTLTVKSDIHDISTFNVEIDITGNQA
jgi:hypothetical protein